MSENFVHPLSRKNREQTGKDLAVDWELNAAKDLRRHSLLRREQMRLCAFLDQVKEATWGEKEITDLVNAFGVKYAGTLKITVPLRIVFDIWDTSLIGYLSSVTKQFVIEKLEGACNGEVP